MSSFCCAEPPQGAQAPAAGSLHSLKTPEELESASPSSQDSQATRQMPQPQGTGIVHLISSAHQNLILQSGNLKSLKK